MRKSLLFTFFIFNYSLFACICEPLPPLSKESFKQYDVIFYGKVDSISYSKSKENIVHFSVIELYQGNSEEQVPLIYDGSSSCMMNFINNEEWIIYATYSNFDKLNVHLCSHSRKKFSDTTKDPYTAASSRSFDDELALLRTQLQVQQLIKRNELIKTQSEFKPHNEQPSNINKVILLTISLLVMVAVYFISKFFKKK